MRAGSWGLRVVLNAGLSDVSPSAASCILNSAMGISPPARSRATQAASLAACRCRKAAMPPCQGNPATAIFAFTPNGMPSSGESGLPSRQRFPEAAASSSNPPRSATWLQTPSRTSLRSIWRRQFSHKLHRPGPAVRKGGCPGPRIPSGAISHAHPPDEWASGDGPPGSAPPFRPARPVPHPPLCRACVSTGRACAAPARRSPGSPRPPPRRRRRGLSGRQIHRETRALRRARAPPPGERR